MSAIAKWEPEDENFWNDTGKRIASRNLVDFDPKPAVGVRRVDILERHHQRHAGTARRRRQSLQLYRPRRKAANRSRVSGATLHASRGRRAVWCDATHSQLVHDRDLRRSQREVHDHALLDPSCTRHRICPQRPLDTILHLRAASCLVWRGRRRVCVLHVQHQLLFPETHARSFART